MMGRDECQGTFRVRKKDGILVMCNQRRTFRMGGGVGG